METYSDSDDDSADRLILNIGGVKFETYITTLQNIPDTRLAWLIENVSADILHTKDFFFDRHPGAFVHILNFYRTGKLHTPRDICGPAFEEELQFWGIDEKQMEPCCWEGFTKHRDAEENLRNFEGPGFEDLRVTDRKISTYSYCVQKRRGCLFDFDKLWNILENPHSSTVAKRFSILSCTMIILSMSSYCLDTLPILESNRYLPVVDNLCLTFFTLELLARIIVTPDRIEFIKNYNNWIDIISVFPSYMVLIFHKKWLKNFVSIRILRVFKFFKLSYGLQVLVHSLKASSYELTLLLLILLIPVVIFSSLVYAVEIAYNSKTPFDSVPRTFWWCIVTMTTVGYGDLTPKTWPGQILGSVCSICGIIVVALPISVIGSNFGLYYAHVRARLKLPKKNRTLLQGNLRALLSQPLSLSSQERERRSLTRFNNFAIRRKQVESNTFTNETNGRKCLDLSSNQLKISDNCHVDLNSGQPSKKHSTVLFCSVPKEKKRKCFREATQTTYLTDTDSENKNTEPVPAKTMKSYSPNEKSDIDVKTILPHNDLDFVSSVMLEKYKMRPRSLHQKIELWKHNRKSSKMRKKCVARRTRRGALVVQRSQSRGGADTSDIDDESDENEDQP